MQQMRSFHDEQKLSTLFTLLGCPISIASLIRRPMYLGLVESVERIVVCG
jgi:hypothetical protein